MRTNLTNPTRLGMALTILGALILAGCGGGGGGSDSKFGEVLDPDPGPAPRPDIIETATDLGSFNTLLLAIETAGLTDTLANGGPFTVFAPTDAAFAKIPTADLNALLADRDALTNVLLYHVVEGELTSDELLAAGAARGLQGGTIRISEGSVMINDSTVVAANVGAGNGIIHGIDTVLTPPPIDDIIDTAEVAGIFGTLLTAVDQAALTDALRGVGPFTVFAPTDEAFAKIPTADLNALLADQDRLIQVLLYHVVPGQLTAEDLEGRASAMTLGGQPLLFDFSEGPSVNGVEIVLPNVFAANGVVHAISSVLFPPEDDIVAAAVKAEFDTLVLALQTAMLDDDLMADGPFTVFAPTEAAFAKIPTADLNALLADPSALADILLYHVVEGRVFSGDLSGVIEVPTLLGQNITVDATNGVMVNGAKVELADLLTTNGVIHVIDTVLIPGT